MVTMKEAEFVFYNIYVAIGIGFFDLVQAEVRKANRPNFTLFAQALKRANGLGLGCLLIWKMNIVNIEIVGI